MRLFLKIVGSIILIFILVFAGGMFYMTRGLDAGCKVPIRSINTAALNDATYDGVYKAGRWTNEVKVTVKDHRIDSIDLIKDVKFSKPEVTREMFKRVIDKQNTDADVITGSTVTCKAYLKSIEAALSSK